MGATVQDVGEGGRGCLDLGENLCYSGPGGLAIWFGDMVDDTANWESVGRILPQGVPQADRAANLEGVDGGWVYFPLVEVMEEVGLQ